MSAISKLEALLSRVQARKAMPRQTSGVAPAFSSSPPATGRVSKAPAPTPLEESMEHLVPVERPRESLPSPFQVRAPQPAPQSDELFLDDFEPPTPRPQPSAQPAAQPVVAKPAVAKPAVAQPAVAQPAAQPAVAKPAAAQPAAAQPAVAQPPAAAVPVPAKPAPINAATARIEPAALIPTSPVSVVSAAPRFEPKTFGDLLDLSLAQRPLK